MAIAYRATGTAAIAGSKVLTLSPTPPAGLTVGDLMLMVCGNCAPSRWIQPSGWGTVDDGFVNDIGSAVFWKLANAADVAAANYPVNFTTSSGAGYACWAVVIAYSGVAAIRLAGLAYVSTVTTAAGALPTPSGAVAGEVVFGAYQFGIDASGTTSYTLTYPTTGSWTQRGTGKTTVASTFNGGYMLVEKAAATDQPTGAVASVTGMWMNTAIILTPTTPTLPSPRTNKSTNPAVANDTTGWSVTGAACSGARVTGATGFSRSTSYRMSITSTPGAGLINKIVSPSVTVNAGERWAGSCEVKSSGTKYVTAVWNWYTAGAAILQPAVSVRVQATTTVQTLVFFGFVAPATVATANIELSTISYDVANADTFEMSGLMMEQIYQAQPYFDGSSLGWVWDGTAGNSSSQASSIPPGNWLLPMMGFHDIDPELDCAIITPKQRILVPGRRNPRHRRVLDMRLPRALTTGDR